MSVNSVILGSGFLGRNLFVYQNKWKIGSSELCSRSPPFKNIAQVDALSLEQLRSYFASRSPLIVFNTVGFGSFVRCESQRAECERLNLVAAKNVTRVCDELAIRHVYISSSYVFSGEKGDYKETDTPNSSSWYGLTKIRAEEVVMRSRTGIVVRLDSLFGVDVTLTQKRTSALRLGSNSLTGTVEMAYPNMRRTPILVGEAARLITEFTLLEGVKDKLIHIAGTTTVTIEYLLTSLRQVSKGSFRIKRVSPESWQLRPPLDSSLNLSRLKSYGLSARPLSECVESLSDNTRQQ